LTLTVGLELVTVRRAFLPLKAPRCWTPGSDGVLSHAVRSPRGSAIIVIPCFMSAENVVHTLNRAAAIVSIARHCRWAYTERDVRMWMDEEAHYCTLPVPACSQKSSMSLLQLSVSSQLGRQAIPTCCRWVKLQQQQTVTARMCQRQLGREGQLQSTPGNTGQYHCAMALSGVRLRERGWQVAPLIWISDQCLRQRTLSKTEGNQMTCSQDAGGNIPPESPGTSLLSISVSTK
jgi:hypothetical protein